VLRLARENAWGYTRIVGELRKLGIAKISRSTVIKILKEHGLEPGPRRGEGSWDGFLKRHAQTLWACDFFSKKVWTMSGLVQMFVLFVIHLGSRRVHVVGMAANPDRAWMVQQARNLALIFEREPVKPKYLFARPRRQVRAGV
jgi:putative transposase